MRNKAIKVAFVVTMVAAAALAGRDEGARPGRDDLKLDELSHPKSYEEWFQRMTPHEVAERLREVWRLVEAGDPEFRAIYPEAWSGDDGEAGGNEVELARDRKAAPLELASGKVRLAARYRTGEGVEQDLGEARRLYLEAAEDGLAEGHLGLAELYFHGEGVPQSYEEALRLFRQAAEGGSADAEWRLGEMYRDGLGVEANDVEAVEWYLQAVEQGHVVACARVLVMYRDQRADMEDMEKSGACLKEAAEAGSAQAQCLLGMVFAIGATHIDEAHWAESIDWLRKSAAQGLEEAVAALIEHNLEGVVPPRSLEMLSSWPGRVPELDDVAILNNFGVLAWVNDANWEIIDWALGHARALGDARAELNLGLLYLHGEGVDKSFVEAVRHFRNVAAKGLPEAMNELGVCYATGRGVRADITEAIRWYRKAAEAGDANAQFNLAMLYARGERVEQNYGEALRWLELAAAEGDPITVGVRDRVAELAGAGAPSQIASAM